MPVPCCSGPALACPVSSRGTPRSEPFSAQLLAYFLGLTGFRLDAAFSAITRSISTHHGDKCHHLWDIRLSGHLSVLCLLPPTVFSWELLLSRGSLISSATCCPGDVTARNVKLCGGEAGQVAWLSQYVARMWPWDSHLLGWLHLSRFNQEIPGEACGVSCLLSGGQVALFLAASD